MKIEGNCFQFGRDKACNPSQSMLIHSFAVPQFFIIYPSISQLLFTTNLHSTIQDFVVNEYMVLEARAYGADTVLLIVAILEVQMCIFDFRSGLCRLVCRNLRENSP